MPLFSVLTNSSSSYLSLTCEIKLLSLPAADLLTAIHDINKAPPLVAHPIKVNSNVDQYLMK